jgi:hypothetical protein
MNKPMQKKLFRVQRNEDWKLHSLRDYTGDDGMVMLKAEMSRPLKGSVDLKKG